MKKLIITLIFPLSFLLGSVEAKSLGFGTKKNQTSAKAASSHAPDRVLTDVAPFLMPDDHKIKHKLDKLFGKARVTQNTQALQVAGFENVEIRKFSQMVVATHPKFPGYFFKMYLDDQDLDEHKLLLKRIQGAKSTKAAIDRHKFNHLFKVPKKWIYQLPESPPPATGSFRKKFILIAEDAKLESRNTNKNFWASRITEEHLKALAVILREEGLNDSVYYFNVPLAKDGRLAFIDTEHHHNWPIYYEKTLPFLSPAMRLFWTELWK